MFKLFPKRINKQRARDALAYVSLTYVAPASGQNIRYSLNLNVPHHRKDSYDPDEALRILRSCGTSVEPQTILDRLDRGLNCSFVDKMLEYIEEKGLSHADVYKAAQVDKRLFSKIIADRTYRPSKDTAVALLLALQLSPDDANDMLSRAGYTLSHSSKRDIILEFCFRERIYNLIDVNDILDLLHQKLIGRS